MAEVFGAATGLFRVASFALQLCESVAKVKEFCDNVKNAPTELLELVEKIEVVNKILKQLSSDGAQGDGVDKDAFQDSLSLCQRVIKRISTAAGELQTQITERRRRIAVKMILKQDAIDRLMGD